MRSKEKVRRKEKQPRFKVLLSMAAYNGEVHYQTMNSIAMLAAASQHWPVKFELAVTANEFITHARNKAAKIVMEDPTYQAVLYVDSDMAFTPQDVLTLWTWMIQGKRVCGGNYSFKKLDWALIRTAARSGVSSDELPFYASRMNGIPLIDDTGENFHEDQKECVRVDSLGAGLLFVHREVFGKIASAHPDIEVEREPNQPESKIFEFFQCGATKLGHMGTEDVFFCRLAQTVGEHTWWPQSVRPGHVGKHVFQQIASKPRENPTLDKLLSKLQSGLLTEENLPTYFEEEEKIILSDVNVDEVAQVEEEVEPKSEESERVG